MSFYLFKTFLPFSLISLTKNEKKSLYFKINFLFKFSKYLTFIDAPTTSSFEEGGN